VESVAEDIVNGDSFSLGVASQLSVEDCGQLCKFIASKYVCNGNKDFEELVNLKKGPMGSFHFVLLPEMLSEVARSDMLSAACGYRAE
jgi:hypothetical protein